jgi:hypothetical protein
MKTAQQPEALASVKPRPTKKAIIEAAVEMAHRKHQAEQEALEKKIEETKAHIVDLFRKSIANNPALFAVCLSQYRVEFECTPSVPLPAPLEAAYKFYMQLEDAKTVFDFARVRKIVTENLNGADNTHAKMVQRLLDTPATAAALSELLPGGKPTLLLK